VLAYLNDHPDEVFSATDCGELAEALGIKLSTAQQTLWSLARDGLAAKAKLARGVWYGSPAAIRALISTCRAAGIDAEPL
jgi:hypothetical protein